MLQIGLDKGYKECHILAAVIFVILWCRYFEQKVIKYRVAFKFSIWLPFDSVSSGNWHTIVKHFQKPGLGEVVHSNERENPMHCHFSKNLHISIIETIQSDTDVSSAVSKTHHRFPCVKAREDLAEPCTIVAFESVQFSWFVLFTFHLSPLMSSVHKSWKLLSLLMHFPCIDSRLLPVCYHSQLSFTEVSYSHQKQCF